MARDRKRLLRQIKKAVKRHGNKHRRRELKRSLRHNPADAHLVEENLGRHQSRDWNGKAGTLRNDE